MNPITTERIVALLGLCAVALAVGLPAPRAAAGVFSVDGNGTIVKQNRQLGHFTGIAVSLPAQVEVRIGDAESATVETDENLLPLVETVVEGGTLKIRAGGRRSIDAHVLKIVVQARQIDQMALGGPGTITADTLRSPKLSLEVGGSGSIQVKSAEADAISASIGGSGSMRLDGGAARKLSVSIGGSGDLQAGKLKADDVSVNIGGSGEATVWAGSALKAAVAGSGDVNYYGDPAVQLSSVGSGRARRLGAAPR